MNNKTVVICVIYTAKFSDDTITLVSIDKESLILPQVDVSSLNPKKNNIDLQSITKLLFEKYVNLNFNWTKPKLLDIDLVYEQESNTSTTVIYYAIYIPHSTMLNNAYWIDAKQYVGHYDTLRKLICML